MILLLYILNLFDAASTHYLVSTGQATEANLFMHLVLSTSWWWFWCVKAGVVGGLCLILYKHNSHRWSQNAQAVGVFVYGGLAFHHFSILL